MDLIEQLNFLIDLILGLFFSKFPFPPRFVDIFSLQALSPLQ